MRQLIEWWSTLSKTRYELVQAAIEGESLESYIPRVKERENDKSITEIRDQLLIIAAVDGNLELLKELDCTKEDVSRLALLRRVEVYSESESIFHYLKALPLLEVVENYNNVAAAVHADSLETVLAYLEKDNDLKDKNIYGLALGDAAGRGKVDCVRLLLERKSDLMSCGTYNAFCFSTDFIRGVGKTYTVTYKEDSAVSGPSGNFALVRAAGTGSTDCMRLLLEAGANETKSGCTIS